MNEEGLALQFRDVPFVATETDLPRWKIKRYIGAIVAPHDLKLATAMVPDVVVLDRACRDDSLPAVLPRLAL